MQAQRGSCRFRCSKCDRLTRRSIKRVHVDFPWRTNRRRNRLAGGDACQQPPVLQQLREIEGSFEVQTIVPAAATFHLPPAWRNYINIAKQSVTQKCWPLVSLSE